MPHLYLAREAAEACPRALDPGVETRAPRVKVRVKVIGSPRSTYSAVGKYGDNW
jgi:hypothetical protein